MSSLFLPPQVIGLDVGNGGLGVSVCSENKLHVWETESGEVRVSLPFIC